MNDADPLEARTVQAAAPSIRQLTAGLMAEPVEDGVAHPAEQLVAAFTSKHGGDGVRAALREFDTRRIADFLRLLGRTASLDGVSRSEILTEALKSQILEIRDAAVQAAESWNDCALASILRAHCEPVDWLADYVSRVAGDLDVPVYDPVTP